MTKNLPPLFRRGWKRTGKVKPPFKRTWIRNYPTSSHYSRHFPKSELDCKCGCVTPPAVARELVETAYQLEKMRDELGGKPLNVISGYRCERHNKAIGGASQSQHRYGTAADVKVPSGEQKRYVAAAERVPAFEQGGIGVYPNGGVHVDHRGYRARWDSW